MVKHKMENLLGFPTPVFQVKKKKKLLYHEYLLLCDRILTASQAAHQIAWLAGLPSLGQELRFLWPLVSIATTEGRESPPHCQDSSSAGELVPDRSHSLHIFHPSVWELRDKEHFRT